MKKKYLDILTKEFLEEEYLINKNFLRDICKRISCDRGTVRRYMSIHNIPYPFIFDNKLKEKIRKRDNYQCKNCNITEEEHIMVVGCVLSIHHIDYDKMNCEEDNLISLCNQCNTRANFNRNYWKKIYNFKMEIKNGNI